MNMRTMFIIGTVVVLLCSLWVSFNHTLDLFRAGGFTHRLEWGVTIAAETSFLMGVLSRFNSRLKGTKPHKEANFMFIVGLLVVGWSNWAAGAAHGWQGIVKGLLVPIFIYGSESVLAREYMEWKKQKEESDQNNDQPNNHYHDNDKMVGDHDTNKMVGTYQHTNKTVGYQNANQMVGYQGYQNEMVGDHQDSYQPDDDHYQPTNQHDTNQMVGYQSEGYHTNDQVDAGNGGSDQMVGTYHTSKEDDHEHTTDQVTNHNNDTYQPDDHNRTTNHEDNQMVGTDQDANQPDSRNHATDQPTNTDQTTNRTGDTNHDNNQPDNSNHDADTEAEIQRVIEVALQLQQQDKKGKLPGRVRLEKAAGCSQWVARKALSELKKTG